jgi:PTH2 family peptidyl-tRNA hydrolase
MPPGKMAAQAGHAFIGALHEAETTSPVDAAAYRADPPGTKVALNAPDEAALLRAQHRAEALGIPHFLVVDSGHVMPPHFTGKPIITALGIGPTTKRKAASITGKFALVP